MSGGAWVSEGEDSVRMLIIKDTLTEFYCLITAAI